jgi:hypothetical protein
MAEFLLNRNHTVRSTSGYALVFQKGIPLYVPPVMIQEVLAIGAERLDAGQDSHVQEPVALREPLGEEREGEILSAIDLIVEKNEPRDFTATGMPTVKAVSAIVGFAVDKRELSDVWTKRNEARAQ